MIFQTLDDKNSCVAIYNDNQIIYNSLPNNLPTKTWKYSSFLKNLDLEYAQLYVNGKSLEECCPEHLKEEFSFINNKLKAFINSFINSKVSLKENCFYDLTPKKFLIEYCEIKNKICDHIFKTYEKPKQYNFYRQFNELIFDIKNRNLNINLDDIKNKLYKKETLNFYRKINDGNKYIDYNMFGTLTGRLTVRKDSFPILTFPKNYRNILKPNNDWFVCFDMNAAELRTALALLDKEQPEGDLHEWSSKNIFNGDLNRSQAKEVATSWLYNSNSHLSLKYNDILDNFYNKKLLKNKYWIDGYVNTPYDRKISCDEHHAISYLNQSTFIDLFHRQILKVFNFLKDKKSYISFMIHDEFVLDLSNEEKEHITEIINILENTPYGKFKVNIKAGKDFGNMKKLNVKA